MLLVLLIGPFAFGIQIGKAVLAPFEGHTSCVTTVAFSLNGKYVLSGSWDCTVQVWEAETGVVISEMHQHKGWVTCIALHPDGERFVSGSEDGTVLLCAIENSTVVEQSPDGEESGLISVAVSPDGTFIASGGWCGRIYL